MQSGPHVVGLANGQFVDCLHCGVHPPALEGIEAEASAKEAKSSLRRRRSAQDASAHRVMKAA